MSATQNNYVNGLSENHPNLAAEIDHSDDNNWAEAEVKGQEFSRGASLLSRLTCLICERIE